MEIRKWYDKYSTDCRLKYPSIRTQENYLCSVGNFLKYFKDEIQPKAIDTEKIKDWLLTFETVNTRNHKLCAIKSFYQITVGMPLKLNKIPFSKKDKKLPIVLSINEIQRMFDVAGNTKHKTILALLYSTGLRVSELINLKWENIDRQRMVINVIQGKGKKDRQLPLNKKLIDLLKVYWLEYKSKIYVLNGQFPDKDLRYSDRSVLEVIKQLATKANIDKRVYTHLIRHCTMTHLVESGTDINIIQRLCGHSNVKTTATYLHISHNLISKINSPINGITL